MATLHAAERVRVGCSSEPGAFAHEFWKVAVDDAVALLDGIVAREDVLGVVVAKWQVKGVKFEKLLKIPWRFPNFPSPKNRHAHENQG